LSLILVDLSTDRSPRGLWRCPECNSFEACLSDCGLAPWNMDAEEATVIRERARLEVEQLLADAARRTARNARRRFRYRIRKALKPWRRP
jgi:hypothetical protein